MMECIKIAIPRHTWGVTPAAKGGENCGKEIIIVDCV